jgi:hypothetical protein
MNPPSAPRPPAPARRVLLALLLGVMAGVTFHYLVYRLSLPSTPFIYVAF